MADEANPKRTELPEIKSCRYMEQWVNALSDGSLKGFARWYTQLHVHRCKQCYAALEALQELKARLQALRFAEDAALPAALSPNRRDALNAAFDEVERRNS